MVPTALNRSARRGAIAGRMLVISLLVGCSDSTDSSIPVALLIVPNPVQLLQQDSVRLVVSALTAQSAVLPDVAFSFASADSSLITVTDSGWVHSDTALGSTTITVTGAGLTAQLAATVLPPPLTAVSGAPYGVAVSPSGVAYVTLVAGQALARFDLPRLTVSRFIQVGDVPTSVAFNSTGARAYVANQLSQNVAVINTATDTWIDTIPVHGDPFVAVTPPGDSLLYVGTNLNQIYIIRLATKTIIDSITTPDAPIFLVPHGGNIYASITFAGPHASPSWTVGGAKPTW